MQLHIGGKEVKEGWKILNAVDAPGVDFVGDVRDLSQFKDGSCSKVYASHVMEHIGLRDFPVTLREISRILSNPGEFYISVPDLEVLCRLFLRTGMSVEQRFQIMRMMFGGQSDDYDFHHIGLFYDLLIEYFKEAGFSGAKRVKSFDIFDDYSNYSMFGFQISLNLIVYK